MMVRPEENERVQRETRRASRDLSPDRNPFSMVSPALSPRTRKTVRLQSSVSVSLPRCKMRNETYILELNHWR